MQPPLLQLIVVSFHLSPPPQILAHAAQQPRRQRRPYPFSHPPVGHPCRAVVPDDDAACPTTLAHRLLFVPGRLRRTTKAKAQEEKEPRTLSSRFLSSFAIASSVAIASVSTTQTTYGPSHGHPPHQKKIPLHTRVPANDVARSAMSLLHHYALAAVREGNEGGGGDRGILLFFFFLK